MSRRNFIVQWTAIFTLISTLSWAQYGAPDGNWPHYGGDFGSTKYSAPDQINPDNVGDLEVLWRWRSPDNALEARKK